jgi:hypothetical protein
VSAEGCHRARADSGAMAPRFDRAIEALARRQHGAFSIHQLHDLGADRYLARRRVAAGRWLRLETGVFALPGNPPTLLRQMKAAELSVPGSAISGTPAACLHEVPDVRIGRLEISAGRNAGRTSLARVRHRGPVPTTTVQDIRVTSLAQTIADIAPSVTAAVLDDARVGDFERDRERDHRAHELGWGVSRFTFAQIERQGYVVGSLLRTFAARQAI